jgi:hypothetical protein
MEDELVYVPGEDDNFVSLSRTRSGKLFRKHILSEGAFYYNDKKINIDKAFLSSVAKNFNDHVVSHVQAPVVDEKNRHSEDPFRNIGEVVGVEIENGKAYALIDVRDEVAAEKVGKTLLGASALLSLNWKNNLTNEYVGPALVHTAITNNAHLNNLEDFEEVLAMSNASSDSNKQAVMLTAAPTNSKESKMDLDEMIAVLRDEHGIDVPELQKTAGKADAFAALSATLQDTLVSSEVLSLSNSEDETSAEDIVAAVSDLVQSRIELSAKVDTLVQESAHAKAEATVDAKIAEGFILPVKRDAALKLLLSDSQLFDEFLPEKPIALSIESGQDIKDDSHDETVESEVSRIAADAARNGIDIQV